MQLTYLDSNSWLIEMADKRILLDPWLVGSLVFANTPWLIKGDRPQDRPIPPNIDLILLSQGLADHAHRPTLKKLPKNIPVVASPNATKVVQELGYEHIQTLDHGEVITLDNLEIRAVKGSPIGITTIENGYILKDLAHHQSLYYEPHGNHSADLKRYAPIDVVVIPLVNISLPIIGAVIKGQETALEACNWLQPKVLLPTAAGGDVHFDGLLSNVMQPKGTVQGFAEMLHAQHPNITVLEPTPGEVTPVLQ